ncbi:glycoside hydrolase family 10 protein [Streptomyces sp. NPDC001380]|uniref:glycoside hydrolase family 10 protein n=1 Tax=Streptomyces sp. NPDC001380 TaxID=3364566 RepID=UPI00368E6F33
MTRTRNGRGRAAALALTLAAASSLLLAPGASAAGPEGGPPAAQAAGTGPCTPDPALPRRQMRGVWIASVVNIDWPASPGLGVQEQKDGFTALLDQAVAGGFNTVFVQIRPTADAFWPSPYEPWSQWLTGVQGKDPGYDPLAFMVAAAHERGLRFHAWFNPYRVSMQDDVTKLVPTHPARVHPDWTVSYGGKLYYDPGVPAARRFVEDAMMDAVTRYDIDGVHFDDYFYPYPVAGKDFPDDASFAAYGAGSADRAAWRRHNVDLLVDEMRQRIHAARPQAAFGISPFGIWRNASTDPAGSATGGFQAYDGLNADTRGWVKKGWLDYVLPQVYWNIGLPVADYAALVPWWSEQVRGTGTALWIGQAAYKAGDPAQPAAWQQPGELSAHLDLDAAHPEVSGDVFFSMKDVAADRLGSMTRVRQEHWRRPALAPSLPKLDGPVPGRPRVTARPLPGGGAELRITAGPGVAPEGYTVARLDGRGAPGCALADASSLLAVTGGGASRTFTDPDGGRGAVYVVTAVNRNQQEGHPAVAVAAGPEEPEGDG